MKEISIFSKLNPFLTGFIGSVFLLMLYLLVLTFTSSLEYAISQFNDLWYWFTPLLLGFGLQVGLYSYIRRYEIEKRSGTGVGLAASSGVSAGAMIACCLHHLAELMPLLGLSVVALFFIEFQIPFIILGIASNLIGISMMLDVIQKHRLYANEGKLSMLNSVDMKIIRWITLILGVSVTMISFIVTI